MNACGVSFHFLLLHSLFFSRKKEEQAADCWTVGLRNYAFVKFCEANKEMRGRWKMLYSLSACSSVAVN